MEELVEVYGTDQFIPILWHAWDDYEIEAGEYRKVFMYGVLGIPYAWFDGYEGVIGSEPWTFPIYDPIVQSHLADPSPLAITAEYSKSDEYHGTINVRIEVTSEITTTDNIVHFVLVEDGVYQDEPHVARAMLDDEPFTLTGPGESVVIQRDFTIDPDWPGTVNPDNFHYIVFVQSHGATYEVLQSDLAVEGSFFILPTVDIKCNGSAGPLNIIYPDPVSLDIEVDSQDAVGMPADSWAIVRRNSAFSVYDGSGPIMGWTFPVAYPFTGHALSSGPLASISGNILNSALPPGSYTGYVGIDPVADNSYTNTPRNITDTVDFTVHPAEAEVVLIWNPADSISGAAMADALTTLGVPNELVTGALPADLTSYGAIFVNLGISPDNHVMSLAEGTQLAGNLVTGGNLYMEGGDTWANDLPTAAHTFFGITDLSEGTSDTFGCTGVTDTFTDGMVFTYSGGNNSMDQLASVAPAYEIFTETTAGYVNQIAKSTGTYNTIGSSFEFGGLDDGASPSTKLELMAAYLAFFGI